MEKSVLEKVSNNYVYIFLLLIIFGFLVTRLYKITLIPASLYWDEASIGYNAYSITVDAKDEWGEFLPLHFRAFGEFKLPVYIYSVSLAGYLLGFSILAVRLPAVLFGLGSIVAIYFLAKELTGKKNIGLLSSFVLAFTPWLFIFTRTGYEATAGLFFYLLGILLFLKGKKNTLLVLISFISFILSMYSYNSFRITSLLTILVLVVYRFAETRSLKKYAGILIVSFGLLLVSLIPIYKLFTQDYGGVRLQQVALQGNNAEQISAFIENYLSHFSLNFLFFEGDANPRSQMPGYGQMFLVTLPLLLSGLYVIIKAKKKRLWLVTMFLLISVIPASITNESPHALRSIAAAPFISILSAMGVYFLYLISKRKPAIIVFFTLLYLIFFFSYFREFNMSYTKKYSQEWQYGYYEVFTSENFNDTNEQKYVSEEYGQPYIFYLFYNKISPAYFRSNVAYNLFDKWGKSTVGNIGEVTFNVVEPKSPKDKVIIFTDKEIRSEDVKEIDEINFIDGETAFWVYEK